MTHIYYYITFLINKFEITLHEVAVVDFVVVWEFGLVELANLTV